MNHKINMTPERALFLLSRKYDDVRFWFTIFGDLTGVWTGKNGRQYAVCKSRSGETIVYLHQ